MSNEFFRPDPGDQGLSVILDLPAVQQMMDDLYQVTGVGFSIIDLSGNVLVGTGWQDICTEFHRKSPAACANCIESDLALTRGVKRGEFKTYKCKNNMWDIVTPLFIGERHMANVFTGQFFFDDEQPDVELFARQAKEFGFDKTAYLDALKRAPRHSREKVASLMDFFTRFSTMVSDLGYTNLKLAEANEEQRQAATALQQSEEKYRVVADFTHDWEYWIGTDGLFTYNSPSCEATTGYTQQEFESDPLLVTRIIHPDDREAVSRHFSVVATDADTHEMRFRIIRKDGAERWLGHVCRPVFDSQGKSLGRRASNRDITQTIEAEQEVLKSRQDLNRAQEVSHLGSWRMDVQQNALSWSDETYRMFEVPPGQSMTYERFLASVHPDDRKYVDDNWQAALRREKVYDIEHRIIVNGRLKWVREKAELEFDKDGTLCGGFGIVHDISDRKQAQEAIQRAAEEWQSTFDSITDIIMLLDPQHRIIRANRAFADTFKMTPEAAVGKHCYEIVHGLDNAPGFCPHKHTMSCGAKACEEFLEPKLGIYIEATTLPIIDKTGRCTGSVHIVKNIHERKTAEKEREKLLRQVENQRQLLESTLDQLPSGVVIRDAAGNLIMGNDEVVRIFGPLPQHISAFDVRCCYRKDGSRYKQEEWPMVRTVAMGETIYNEEIDIVPDDGRRMTVLAATAPVRNEAGEVIAHVGVFRDITERKQIETQLEIMSRFPKENPNPVLRVTAQGALLYANHAADHVLGCWHAAVGGALPDSLRDIVAGTLVSGDDRTVEVDCGGVIYSFVFTPITEFGYVNLYGRDISERKRADLALKKLNAELESRVEERTHELTVAHTKLLEQLEYRVQAEESLRSLSSRLLSIQEEERRAIARELHDQTGQSLTVLKLMVGRADRIAAEEMKPLLGDITGMITEIIKQVRSLSLSLRPGVLDDLGLVPAMEWLFKQLHTQADLQVHFERDAIAELTQDANTAIYRITQEALTNIMRHAGVKEVWVRLVRQDGKVTLRIEDRGRGFDSAAAGVTRSTGLSAMRERAALLGGHCRIESSPGKGTVITISLPLANQIR